MRETLSVSMYVPGVYQGKLKVQSYDAWVEDRPSAVGYFHFYDLNDLIG